MGRVTISLLEFFLLGILQSGIVLGGNGKLSGRILDGQTGSPVLGNVQVIESAHGSAADSAGSYLLLDIPPGTYTIRCSAVGYRAQVVAGLAVTPDNLRVLDFRLQPEEVALEEVVVQADRMAVQSSQTSARTDFEGSEFRRLPLNSAMDLISLSPGTFKQFVGGLPPFYSRTTVDGIDITDETALWFAERAGVVPSNLNGGRDITTAQRSSFVEPNLNAIEQATLLTGTAGPDYANAAGTVAYALREGRGAFGGEAAVRVSQLGGLRHLGPDIYWDAHEYFAQRASLVASTRPGDRGPADFYTWTPGKYSYGSRPDLTASLSFGGSLSEAVGIHASAAWLSTADRLPNEKTQRFNASTKLTWALSPTMRLSVVGLLEDRGRLLGWKNSSYMETYRYFLEGVPLWDGVHITGGLKWSHFLSQRTWYDIQVSLVHDNVRRGFCDDNNDGVVSLGEHGDFLTWSDTSQVNRYQAAAGGTDFTKFFAHPLGDPLNGTKLLTSSLFWRLAHPTIYYENSTNRVVTLKGDLTSQVDSHHLLGCGVQARVHTLDRELRTGAWAVGGEGFKTYVEELWTHFPAELGLYLQDRMEYLGLIMNAGIRLDGISLDAAPIANWYAPPDTVSDGQGGRMVVPPRGARLGWNWFISPRVAFSHPIGQSAAVHVSFSRTRLTLPFSYLFANYNTGWTRNVQLSAVPIVNVDHEPVSTLNYDLGIQWAVAPATLIGVNAYYREHNNMSFVTLMVLPGTPLPRYYVVTNSLGADAKGIEISLQRQLTPMAFGVSVGGRVAYAYSRMNVGAPVPSNKSQYSAAAGDSTAYEGRLPFDDIALWDRSNIEILGGRSTLTAGFSRAHRVTCSLTITAPWDVRLSGTGMFSSGFWYPEKLKADRILPYAESPWNRRVDIRLEKQFPLSDGIHVDVFVDVLNLFNWTNVLAYYDTPETAQTAWEVSGDPTGGSGVNRPVTPEGTLVYDIPREFYFGFRIGF